MFMQNMCWTVGSTQTAEIGRGCTGPKVAQVGRQITGLGLGCGLGAGVRLWGSAVGRFSPDWAESDTKKNRARHLGRHQS